MKNPIKTAVEPLKIDAITRAEQNERAYVETVRAGLAAAGNDIDVFAPRPENNMSREVYMLKQRRRGEIMGLCNTVSSPRNFHGKEPYIVKMCAEKIEKHITETKRRTALQYDAFVEKLVKKIGDTTEAIISGNHVWGYSFLTVTLPGSEVQKWKTQQIVNRSVLGLLFNQWPSRKVNFDAA